jgi:CheY-like chemotaxis protein
MKILFVDDEPDTRDFFHRALSRQGHEIWLARNGLEAIDIVRSEPFDALVIDGEMPRMNGWDAIYEIRSLANGRDLPIILFTAIAGGHDDYRAKEAGATLLLSKPLLPQEMINHLTTLTATK